MHSIQEKLLQAIKNTDISGMTLREMGDVIDVSHPQKIQHHLNQLEKRGLILRDEESIKAVEAGPVKDSGLVSIPVLGLASCGVPVALADEVFEGFIQVSNKLLRKQEDIFSIKAQGNSMNRAKVGSEKLSIEDGDYVLVDASFKDPKHGDYVVVAVDEVAAIKRFAKDGDKIILVSESTQDYPPIYLHADDKFIINGRVIQVIKSPKVDWYFKD
ncbi:MAG: S24 family peptidase [Candidatus Spechtbacterales bacterium]|nr:S24 family peptidase [Candidatus Spechtbacterales bacterium]